VAGHVGFGLPLGAFADPGGDFLVDISKILDVAHVVAGVVEPAGDHVGVGPEPRVAEVGVVRDRQPADVQQDLVAGRLEGLALACQGVGHGE